MNVNHWMTGTIILLLNDVYLGRYLVHVTSFVLTYSTIESPAPDYHSKGEKNMTLSISIALYSIAIQKVDSIYISILLLDFRLID